MRISRSIPLAVLCASAPFAGAEIRIVEMSVYSGIPTRLLFNNETGDYVFFEDLAPPATGLGPLSIEMFLPGEYEGSTGFSAVEAESSFQNGEIVMSTDVSAAADLTPGSELTVSFWTDAIARVEFVVAEHGTLFLQGSLDWEFNLARGCLWDFFGCPASSQAGLSRVTANGNESIWSTSPYYFDQGSVGETIEITPGRYLVALISFAQESNDGSGSYVVNGNILTTFAASGRCRADVTTINTNPGDTGFGEPDGESDGADLSYFVEGWLAGDLTVGDATTTNTNPGGTLFGVPDGIVDGADLSWFVEAWLTGCS